MDKQKISEMYNIMKFSKDPEEQVKAIDFLLDNLEIAEAVLEKDIDYSTDPGKLVEDKITDAMLWAKAFVYTMKNNNWTPKDIDEGLMVGWFANAIEVAKEAQGEYIRELQEYKRMYDDLCK